MIIYHNHIIITPIKTGTISTRKLFLECIGGALLDEKWQEGRIKWHSIDHSAIRIKDKKVWLLVRNPYERLLSIYYYFVNPETRSVLLHQPDGNPLWEHINSFEDFLDSYIIHREAMWSTEDSYWLKRSERNINWHLLIHLQGLYADSQATGYIKIESLSEELQKLNIILEDKCLSQSRQRENIGQYRTEQTNWEDFFNTPSLIKKANIICAEDAKKFNYPILKEI